MNTVLAKTLHRQYNNNDKTTCIKRFCVTLPIKQGQKRRKDVTSVTARVVHKRSHIEFARIV